MFGLIIFIHVMACILLIAIILIQRGHGGGLVESLSNLDSMFGVKTNTFLSKTTTVLSTIFLFTCLVLALLSAKQSKSLMERVAPAQTQTPAKTQTQAQIPTQTEALSQEQVTAQTPAKEVQSQTQPMPSVPEPQSQQQPEANKTE